MDCTLCEEPITNPLCPDCLCSATAQWLQDKAPERIEDLHRETDSIRRHEGEMCVRCKSNFRTCTYCYTKEIFNWLGNAELQLGYLQYFNFLT